MSGSSYKTQAGLGLKHINGGQFPLDRFYSNEVIDCSTVGLAAFAANFLSLMPFIPPTKAGRFVTLAVPFQGAALVGNARVGLYESESLTNLYPTNKLVEIELDTNVGASFVQTAIDVDYVPSKVYWLFHNQSVNKNVASVVVAQQKNVLGSTSADFNPAYGFRIVFAYGVSPDTFPANQPPTTGLTYPRLFLKLSQ